MIREYIEGDLVTMLRNSINGDAPPMFAAQGCNCFQVQSAGLARHLQRFPDILHADLAHGTKGDMNKLGDYSYVHLGNDTFVFNLYTQYEFNSQQVNVDYSAIRSAFRKLNALVQLDEYKGQKFYIPFIGAGLAGGTWSVILQYINDATPNLDLTVVNFKPNLDPRVAPQ